MFPRHWIGLALLALQAVSPQAQQPEAIPTTQGEEPRYRIQLDVTATVPDDERWIELQSKNFTLAGTASEDDIRKTAADLELIRYVFAQLNPRVEAISPVQTTVLVFQNAASMRWYRPESDAPSEKAKGYIHSSPDKNYIVVKQGSELPRELKRDYVRQLIPQAMAPVPLWFREGLSDYFSALKIERFLIGDKRWLRLGAGIDDYDRLLDKKAKLLPFETLFKINEDSPEFADPAVRRLFFAESWGVVHYLMSRPGGTQAMQRLFNLLGDGEPLESALQKTLRRSSKLLEDDYKRYIRISHDEHQWTGSIQLLTKSMKQVEKGECGRVILTGLNSPRYRQCFWGDDPDPPGVFRIPYAFDRPWAEISPLKAHPISEAEAWFYRGDLMLHAGRFGEAEAYLQRAVRQPTQFSRTLGALGLLQIQQKQYNDAEKSLQQALELDPQNYLAHYYRCVLIQLKALQVDTQLGYDDVQEIHAELLKVLKIAPQFVEASEMLAGINLIRQTAGSESQKILVESLTRYPGRTSLWLSLSAVAARNGDPNGARWLLTRLLTAGAPDPETRKAATKLLTAIAPGAARAIITTPVPASGPAGGFTVATAGTAPKRGTSKPAGEKLSGTLTNIECRNGLTFIVKAGGKTVKLHTNSAFSVDFIVRDRGGRAVSTANPIVCGPVASVAEDGISVVITYRPGKSGDSIGEPLNVEIRLDE